MKFLPYFLVLGTLSGVLAACDQNVSEEGQGTSPAVPQDESSEATPPGATASSHFDAVLSHLDLGGTFFAYADVDGDLESLLGTAEKVLDSIRQETGEDIPDLDLQGIGDELGLPTVDALGGSSIPIPQDRFRNKVFVHTPEGPQGLLTLFGSEASPFTALNRAPAGCDIVVEQDIHLAPLREIVLGVYEKLPKDQGIPPLDQMMGQPLPGLNMTPAEILEKANGRALFLAKFDDTETLDLPFGQIPAFDFLLDLQGFGWLFEKLQGFLPQEGPFQREEGDGFTRLTMQRGAIPFPFFQPVLLHQQEGDRLILASRPDFLAASEPGTEGKLQDDPAFQDIFQDLPTDGNALTYLSPKVQKVLGQIAQTVLAQNMPGNAGNPGDAAPQQQPSAMGDALSGLVDAVMENLSTMASVTVVEPNGIYAVSHSAASLKSGLVFNAVALPGIIAAAVGSSQSETVVVDVAAVDQAHQHGDAAVANQTDGIEKAVAALRQYAVANNGDFPDTLADLVPDQLSAAESEIALQWQTRNGAAALVYFSGLSVNAEENPIILAAPEPDDNGQRVVAHIDGTLETVSEDAFFQMARAALEKAN